MSDTADFNYTPGGRLKGRVALVSLLRAFIAREQARWKDIVGRARIRAD